MKFRLLLLATLLSFVACSKKDVNEVVVYTTVDQIFSEPILDDFEKDSGIKVKALYDTEETKSTGLLNRLISEKNNPQCDVFWSGDPMRTIVLKNMGITTKYIAKGAKDIPTSFIDKDYHQIGFSARARVLIYNNKMIKKDNIPKSIFDLLKPKYKGDFTIANPLFGTTSFHFASLFVYLGDKKAKDLFDGLKLNGVIVATSNGDVKRRVMSGEVALGLTDTDDAFEAMKESKDVGFVFLDQDKIGTLIMPNTLSLLKNSPNSENGKILIEYLLSKDTQRKLAISSAQMPLTKGVKTPKGIPSLDNIKAMDIDYNKSAKKIEEIKEYLKKWAVDKR